MNPQALSCVLNHFPVDSAVCNPIIDVSPPGKLLFYSRTCTTLRPFHEPENRRSRLRSSSVLPLFSLRRWLRSDAEIRERAEGMGPIGAERSTRNEHIRRQVRSRQERANRAREPAFESPTTTRAMCTAYSPRRARSNTFRRSGRNKERCAHRLPACPIFLAFQ